MSRSRKKAIYKDKGIRPYWRFVRSSINNSVRGILHLIDKEDYNIPNAREIIDDWEYCDYRFDCEYKCKDSEWKEKLTRK